MKITQEELKIHLSYDPNAGVFVWLTAGSGRVIGDVAGYVNNAGYVMIGIGRARYLAHRLVFLYMLGAFPKNHTDHINHIRDDNRMCNLRAVTVSENKRNGTLHRNNKSGVTGVCRTIKGREWQAFIWAGKSIPLGTFRDKFEAICARKSADNKYGFHKNHGMPSKLY